MEKTGQNIPEGYKRTEIGIIPEDWEVKNINEISTLKARIGWQGLTTSEYLKYGDYILITGTDFYTGKIKWEKCVYVGKKRYNQDKNIQIKKNDILITKDGTIGKVAFIYNEPPKPATLNSGIFVVRPKNKTYYPLFVFYLFNSEFFTIFLKKLMAGSTINHLYQKDFINFLIPLPPVEEQRAIARVLSDFDRLIELLDKLIEKKKLIKKGAMQQLLTGKKRLPGFTGEWVKKKLGEVTFLETGRRPRGGVSEKGDIPSLGGENIKLEGGLQFDSIKRVSFDFFKNMITGILKKNDVLINKDGANTGKVAIYKGEFKQACINEHLFIIRGYSNILDNVYLYYFLNQHKVKQEIKKLITSSAQPGLNRKFVNNIFIYFPPTLAEQRAIARVLSDMDAEIEALEKKKQKYEQMKRGAMELLLTGKVRLINKKEALS